jgi:hypothetical protein
MSLWGVGFRGLLLKFRCTVAFILKWPKGLHDDVGELELCEKSFGISLLVCSVLCTFRV